MLNEILKKIGRINCTLRRLLNIRAYLLVPVSLSVFSHKQLNKSFFLNLTLFFKWHNLNDSADNLNFMIMTWRFKFQKWRLSFINLAKSRHWLNPLILVDTLQDHHLHTVGLDKEQFDSLVFTRLPFADTLILTFYRFQKYIVWHYYGMHAFMRLLCTTFLCFFLFLLKDNTYTVFTFLLLKPRQSACCTIKKNNSTDKKGKQWVY